MTHLTTTAPLPPAPPVPDSAQLIAAPDVAQLLQVSVRTLYRMVKRGQFPGPSWRGSRKVVRWRHADVTAWVQALPDGKDGVP